MTDVHAFSCEFRWHGRLAFFIWLSSDIDGVVMDAGRSLKLFDSLDSLSEFAKAEGLILSNEEPSFWDFDNVLAWSAKPRPPVDCPRLLDTWNMLADIHASRGNTNDLLNHADQRARAAYEKLFWGCNLPVVTPEGQRFNPIWSQEDCLSLARLLRLGLAELDAAVPKELRTD
jgi:hypothetical protein